MAEATSFEIHIDDRAVDSGAVPVRWCLGAAMAERVASGEACVLIVVQALDVETGARLRAETRQVLALDDLMTFVSFTHPGRNRIYAFLVSNSVRRAKKDFLKRENGRRDMAFNMAVVDRHADPDEREYCRLEVGYYHVEAIASRDVEVPKEIFAPEPPEWEKYWVNLWYSSAPVDQCHFRRRRILAYTLKPPVFVVAVVVRYLFQICRVLWLALLATRGDYWRVLRHPSTSVDHYNYGGPGSLYASTKPHAYGVPESPMMYARIAASPLAILVSAFVSYPSLKGMWVLLGALALPLVGLLVSLVMIGIAMVIDRRNRNWYTEKPTKQPALLTTRRAKRFTKEDLGYLTCDIAPGKASLATLPRRRRTIRLHLQELKRKVCRPFAG